MECKNRKNKMENNRKTKNQKQPKKMKSVEEINFYYY